MCNVVLRIVQHDIMCAASLFPKQHIPNWFVPSSFSSNLHLPGGFPLFAWPSTSIALALNNFILHYQMYIIHLIDLRYLYIFQLQGLSFLLPIERRYVKRVVPQCGSVFWWGTFFFKKRLELSIDNRCPMREYIRVEIEPLNWESHNDPCIYCTCTMREDLNQHFLPLKVLALAITSIAVLHSRLVVLAPH